MPSARNSPPRLNSPAARLKRSSNQRRPSALPGQCATTCGLPLEGSCTRSSCASGLMRSTAQPSQADELLTRNLKDALALVDVKVLDHFIIAGNHALSFAERGLL